MSAIAFPSLGGPDEPLDRRVGGGQPEITWAEIAQRAPLMASTMATYLDQLSVSARPATVGAFEIALRFFAGRVTEEDRWCVCVADVERRHIEDFKLWQAKRPGKQGKKFSTTTIRTGWGSSAPSSSGSSSGAMTTPRPGCPSSPVTSRRPRNRCPSSSTTGPWPSSWPQCRRTPTHVDGS